MRSIQVARGPVAGGTAGRKNLGDVVVTGGTRFGGSGGGVGDRIPRGRSLSIDLMIERLDRGTELVGRRDQGSQPRRSGRAKGAETWAVKARSLPSTASAPPATTFSATAR